MPRAKIRHRFALKPAGDKAQSLVDFRWVLPWHRNLPPKRKVLPMCPVQSVTHVSSRSSLPIVDWHHPAGDLPAGLVRNVGHTTFSGIGAAIVMHRPHMELLHRLRFQCPAMAHLRDTALDEHGPALSDKLARLAAKPGIAHLLAGLASQMTIKPGEALRAEACISQC